MESRQSSQLGSEGEPGPERSAGSAGLAGAERGAIAGIALACVTGGWLRASGLGRQILIDDEFHAFRAGLRRDLDAVYLFTHNTLPEDPLSDFSSPLALWVRLLANTVGIDEWGLRAPLFVASVALIAVVGWLGLRAGRGARVGLLAAWLAAASPLLVVFARFARPYALVALCGGLALLAADAFRRRASSRNAIVLGSACALGAWFNVSALPALAVLGWLGLMPALAGRLGDAARRAAFTGAVVAVVLGLALLGPSVEALRAFAEAKAQSAPASWTSWGEALAALAGARSAAAAVAFFALAGLGCWVLTRSATSLAGLGLAALVAQSGAFVLLRPYGGDEPLVIARYGIAALPGVLLFVAVGLDAAVRRIPSPVGASVVAGVVLGAGFAIGPLPEPMFRENAFTSRPSNWVGSGSSIDVARAPAFYAQLAESPGPAVVAELPWVLEWPLAIAADYQRIHQREVRTATGFWTFRDPAVRFGTQLRWRDGEAGPDLDGVDYAVVHLDWVREWTALTGAPMTMDPDRLAEAAKRYRIDASALDRWIGRHPDWKLEYEDEQVHVYKRR